MTRWLLVVALVPTGPLAPCVAMFLSLFFYSVSLVRHSLAARWDERPTLSMGHSVPRGREERKGTFFFDIGHVQLPTSATFNFPLFFTAARPNLLLSLFLSLSPSALLWSVSALLLFSPFTRAVTWRRGEKVWRKREEKKKTKEREREMFASEKAVSSCKLFSLLLSFCPCDPRIFLPLQKERARERE